MKTPDSRTKEEVYQFVSGFLSKVHTLGIVNESGYVELMIRGKVHRFYISEMECNKVSCIAHCEKYRPFRFFLP